MLKLASSIHIAYLGLCAPLSVTCNTWCLSLSILIYQLWDSCLEKIQQRKSGIRRRTGLHRAWLYPRSPCATNKRHPPSVEIPIYLPLYILAANGEALLVKLLYFINVHCTLIYLSSILGTKIFLQLILIKF